jgi:hypothetical protein
MRVGALRAGCRWLRADGLSIATASRSKPRERFASPPDLPTQRTRVAEHMAGRSPPRRLRNPGRPAARTVRDESVGASARSVPHRVSRDADDELRWLTRLSGDGGRGVGRGDSSQARIDDRLRVRRILGNGRSFCASGFWKALDGGRASHVPRDSARPASAETLIRSKLGAVRRMALQRIRDPPRCAISRESAFDGHPARRIGATDRLAS